MRNIIIAALALGACSSTGGGGTQLNPGFDGGQRPNEACGPTATCGTNKTYQLCTTGSGTTCQSRYLTGDGSSFNCASCSECSQGKVQVTAWCNGGSASVDMAMPPAVDDSKCTQMFQITDCQDCCAQNHPAANMSAGLQLADCLCGAAGVCANTCANSLCQGLAPHQGGNCDTCAQLAQSQGGPCDVLDSATCNSDPDCAALAACASTCQ